MGDTVFDDPDGLITSLARRVVTENAAYGRTVALAESCTGGMVSTALTDVAGSSAIFEASFVTYSNQAKHDLLGVPNATLDTAGAVSPECACAMVAGVLERTAADLAVSITGIAGPGGGSSAKPVGTVIFGRARRGDTIERYYCSRESFGDKASRAEIRRRATIFALRLLLPESDARHGIE